MSRRARAAACAAVLLSGCLALPAASHADSAALEDALRQHHGRAEVVASPDSPAWTAKAGARAASAPRRSQPGNLVWEDRFDVSRFEQMFSVAADAGRAYTAGYVFNPPRGRDFVVRAYEGRDGALAWTDQVDKGGDDFASGVALDGSLLFVSGVTSSRATRNDWLLRAYDAPSGRLVWERAFDLAGGVDFSRGTALAAVGGRVFLAGYGTSAAGDHDAVVLAYDAASGRLLWRDVRDADGASDGVHVLTAEDESVYAGGWATTADADHAVVRAHDATTGALRWERRTLGAPGFGLTYTRELEAAGGTVFAGQAVLTDDHVGAPVVQAYDAASGALRWRAGLQSGGQWEWLGDLAVARGRVAVVGHGGPHCTVQVTSGSNCDATVRSFGTADGRPLWERRLELSGVDDQASLVAWNGNTVLVQTDYAATFQIRGCCTLGHWVVHAFDGTSGRPLWQSVGPERESGVYDMEVDRETLFVPGRSIDVETGDWDAVVRAYDVRARTGEVAALPFVPLPELSLRGTSGELSFVAAGAGPLSTAPHGLVVAEQRAGQVVDDPADDLVTALRDGVGYTAHEVTVPPGTRLLRAALYDEDTDGDHDLDLYVYRPDGRSAGGSGGFTSEERVDVVDPPAGVYTVVVHGYATDGPDAGYELSWWATGDADEGNMTVSGPTGDGVVTVRWSGLSSGSRYLGAISYRDDMTEVGRTVVAVRS